MAWYTTLLCIVPPNKGCGWHTRAERVAAGAPSFSSPSSLPAGPSRKNDLIPLGTIYFYHRVSIRQAALGTQPKSEIYRKGREGHKDAYNFFPLCVLCVRCGDIRWAEC